MSFILTSPKKLIILVVVWATGLEPFISIFGLSYSIKRAYCIIIVRISYTAE